MAEARGPTAHATAAPHARRALRMAEGLRWAGQIGAILGVLGIAAATAVPDLPRDGTGMLVAAVALFGVSAVVGAIGVVRAERLRAALGPPEPGTESATEPGTEPAAAPAERAP